MTKEELNYEYLDWMYNRVCNDRYSKKTRYRNLFAYLYNTDFEYTMPMDGNRAEDGVNLRYRFGREQGYPDSMIASYLDDRPCSVLEMMIALAIRCETYIMDNSEYGDRTGQWFWEMIVCLGLGHMTDENFDDRYADTIMDIFMNRKYAKNGKGGLFEIHDPSKDMRQTDIWYQMCFHLNEVLGE